MAFTLFALAAIVVHGVYHLAEAGYAPRLFYQLLNPIFAPTLIGWSFHIFVELIGIVALVAAVLEYRDASSEVDILDWEPGLA